MVKMLSIKRIIAYFIDYLIISIPLMIICMMIGTLPMFDTNGDYPFMVISFVYMPHIFWGNLISYPGNYGNLSWLPSIIAASAVFESVVYSLQMHFRHTTPGNKRMRLQIVSTNQSELGFGRIFLWNTLRVFSKYLLAIPLLICILSKRKHTVYDSLIGIEICVRQAKPT